MKRIHILAGTALMAVVAGISSCSHDFDETTPGQQAVDTYKRIFIETFGEPSPDHTWGFDAPASSRVTRSITVNGDTYDKFNFPSDEELAAAFPTAIPTNADEVSQLETLYKGTKVQTQYGETTLWDIYAIYQHKIVEGYNLKVTQAGIVELGGNYQNSAWDGSQGREIAHPYNVYVDVDGDLTIRRVGATHFNLYILRGNVTLESNYGEQAGSISVAEGATLNDQRSSIAANQGIKLYNRGTVNATNTEKYDIGNFSTVYNQGKFNVSGPLTYSPGDANTSYFVNFSDDAEITAPQMTMNSSCHFYNDGRVIVTGNTFVTQARINWINNGYYQTGTMTFSAKNNTFYNYCQLIVTGNAHMYDGEFNLMQNSYTEAGTAEMDNFIVNMGSNTGMYIKGDVRMIAQGDGTFQGFRTNGGSNDYLLIGGKVTVDAHYHTFSVSEGITYSVNQIEIIKGNEVVTDEYLRSIGDGAYPVLDLNGTACPYGELTVTPNTNSCGANWSNGGGTEETWGDWVRIIAEDLSVTQRTDFDFNDVVFDVRINTTEGSAGTKAQIRLKAAGGTLPLTVGWDGLPGTSYSEYEVHNLYKVATNVMVNTHAKNGVDGKADVTKTLTGTFNNANDIKVMVQKRGEWTEITAHKGEPASKIQVKTTYQWCDERDDISDVYNGTRFRKSFIDYVKDPSVASDWYE